jgi:hypothetical protein
MSIRLPPEQRKVILWARNVYEALAGALNRGLSDRRTVVRAVSFRSLFIHNTSLGSERVACECCFTTDRNGTDQTPSTSQRRRHASHDSKVQRNNSAAHRCFWPKLRCRNPPYKNSAANLCCGYNSDSTCHALFDCTACMTWSIDLPSRHRCFGEKRSCYTYAIGDPHCVEAQGRWRCKTHDRRKGGIVF